MMDTRRWQRLQELFAQGCALPVSQHPAFVAQACSDDEEMARELARLLALDAAGRSRSDADDVAARALVQAAARWAGGARQTLVGQRLGPWQVLAHHADGGMGAVYRGERADGRYQQTVAIKLINPAMLSEDGRQRLLQERQILARLAHPHIARLLDGGETADGLPYLVMEFVDGLPIDAWCRAHRSSVAERLRLMIKVCHAVDHAHRNLVVHRDLKPGNILVDALGEPRLLDFGIAKLTDAPGGVTASAARPLTPSHASPEQVSGGPITTATDVYALGVLLYDLLTGRLPHADSTRNPAALARAIVETDPLRPSHAVTSDATGATREQASQRRGDRLTPQRLARELEGDLDNIVLMALRKQPERRYATAAALADDVDRYLAHQPVRARADTLGYRSAKFVRRHPVAVPVSALAVVLALGGSAAFTWQLGEERRAAQREALRANRVADFMAGVFRVADPQESASAPVSARQLLDNAAGQIGRELRGEPQLQAALRRSIASAYLGLGLYPPAREQAEQALALGMETDHPDDVESARQRAVLGEVLIRQGEFDEAVEVLQRALQAQTGAAQEAGPDRVHTLLALGTALWRQGKDYEGARRTLLDALAQAEAVGDSADAARAAVMTALAGFFGFRGELTAARDWAERSLALNRQLFGDEHPRAQESQSALATALMRLSRYAEAAEVYESSLMLARRTYGNEHIRTAYLLANLGGLRTRMGQYAQAEAVTREALPIFERRLGADHPRTAFLLENLANAIIDQGPHRHEEALALYRATLAKVQQHFGPEHAEVGISLHNMAGAYERTGRHAEALPLAQEAVRLQMLSMGPDSTQVAEAHNKVAGILFKLGQFDAAIATLAQAEAATDAGGGGPVHALRQTQITLRGEIELARGQPAAAEPWLRRGLDMQRQLLAQGGPLLSQSELLLGDCLRQLGRTEEAEPLLVSAHTGLASTLGAEDPLVQRARQALVDLYLTTGRPELAASPALRPAPGRH